MNAVLYHNHSLAVLATKKIAEIWGTKPLTNDTSCIGYLSNIEVPSSDLELCTKIAYEMMDDHNCFPIFFKFDGKVFTRISAQIFNELSDY